jgi:hypothetical protein
MPRYFFDTSDGDSSVRDDEGVECNNLEEVGAQAVAALSDMASDKLPDGDRREFVVEVRNESGRSILRATLSLNVEHL